jgi:phytoene synthase
MNAGAAFAACEATVRRFDHDRYFASLFAPADKRPLLYALYAFNHELARAGEAAREPAMTEIRLQWWREMLQSPSERHPLPHPAATGVAELLNRSCVSAADLEALIGPRETEILPAPFATLAAMESHAEATSSALMHIAAQIVDPAADTADLTREAGIAYGLAGMLRSLPFHFARGKLFLPADLLAAGTLSGAIPAHSVDATTVVAKLSSAATHHLARARKSLVPRSVLPAVLPASLVPAYLLHLQNCGDPLRARTEISQLRRQLTILRAALLNRI